MKLLASDDQLRPLDSLMIIELVAALEDATGVDLLGGPLTPETFASVQSISEFIERASAG